MKSIKVSVTDGVLDRLKAHLSLKRMQHVPLEIGDEFVARILEGFLEKKSRVDILLKSESEDDKESG